MPTSALPPTPLESTLASQFHLLPWEDDYNGNPISGNGERLITRQEIDWPIDAAPFKIVPYGLGELGDWGEDINGDRFQRAIGQAGVRASIPFWYADPTIHDALVQPQRSRSQSHFRRAGVCRRLEAKPRPLSALRRTG